MDSLTHIALGACMGEAFAGKKLGKKAMLWGALAQSVPDIDFLASFWMEPSASLLAHRGFTHSFLFCLLVIPLLALSAEYWHRPHNISLKKWVLFFGGVIFAHILIDAFNNYGVGWFEPFSHLRISFNAIYVADPFFSIWSGIAFLLLIIARRRSRFRKRYWQTGLGLSALYLVYCLINKSIIDTEVKQLLHRQRIHYTRYFITPAPFQNSLWYVVAGTDSGYYVGFRSLFDRSDAMSLQYFPRNDWLLRPMMDHTEVHQLIRFSKQFYTVERWDDMLVFNDLRFGQIMGWNDRRGRFVFHYYLQHGTRNRLVVQRGRLEGWNRHTFQVLWHRIKGDE